MAKIKEEENKEEGKDIEFSFKFLKLIYLELNFH